MKFGLNILKAVGYLFLFSVVFIIGQKLADMLPMWVAPILITIIAIGYAIVKDLDE